MLPPSPPSQDIADRLLEIVRLSGVEATSFQCIEPGLETFFTKDGQAAVCYAETGGSFVVAGGPICREGRCESVLLEFTEFAKKMDRRAVFFCAEERTVDAARRSNTKESDSVTYTWVKIGEQPYFDLQQWSLGGARRRNVRAQVHRARNHGVTIREAESEELDPGGELRARVKDLIIAWQDSRTMSPMGFLVDLHPFQCPEERRYFVAFQGGRLVGFLAAIPIFRRRGWFVEDLIRLPDAPNGTAESLIHFAFTAFKQSGFEMATLGLAPLSGGEFPPEKKASSGIGAWLPWVFSLSYRRANRFYSFKGLRAFKEKFRPEKWEPIFVVANPAQVNPAVVWDMLSAFIPGSRVQFTLDSGVRVLRGLVRRVPLRAWEGMAWALSLLLIPWIVMLLSVDPIRRFGTEWLPKAWAGFDAMMALAFLLLAVSLRHWRRFAWSLSRVMLGAVLADVWLTTSQVLLFNRPSATHWLDNVVGLLAISAPVFASVFLGLLVVRFHPKH